MQSQRISLKGVVSVAFFSVMLFGVAAVAHAEDPCLRGGNGNCVALTKEVNAPGGAGQVFAENMLDSAASHNVVTLKDGTLVAAVARAISVNSSVFTRYIIELWVSKDGGVTWSLPGIQQPWYVDQVNITRRTLPVLENQTGAGFLGFSLAASERTTGTYLFLAHSLVCRGTALRGDDLNVTTSCSIPSGNNNWESVSTVALETLSYDSATNTFGTAAPTENVSNFGTTATGCWGITACFGLGYGADHPNIWASSATTNVVISFSAYRGDSCTAANCPGQTGVNGPASVGQYILHDMFNGTHSFDTPLLFDCANTSCKPSEINEGVGTHAEEHAYYSMLTGPTDAFRPIIAFGFSDKGRPEAVLGMRFYNGTSWQVVNPQVLGATIYATTNSSVGNPQKKVPQFSLAMSNTEYAFQPSGAPSSNKYVHMAVMADQSLLNGKQTAMPFYLKFEIVYAAPPNPWSIAPDPIVVELADASSEGTYKQFNKTGAQAYQAYIESGGPTLGFSAQNLYIAFPAAPITPATSFTAANAHVYYVRLRSNINQPQSSTAPKYRWDGAVTLDTESGDPIYARMTAQNDASPRGYATPVLPQFLFYRNESYSPTSLSNVFNPPMIFGRNTADALSGANITTPCSASNPCAASFSGEPQTRGIRGWGWASTVGWISLSCDNLQTCYHKYSPYSLQDDGGYYGVRVVINPKVTQTPVIGRMWSDRVGYISFDRKDSISASYNPCGNPPSGFTRAAHTCVLLDQDMDDTYGGLMFVSGNLSGFPASGYVMIDNEIVSYSGKGADSLTVNGRGISGARYSQPARAHLTSTADAPTPVYFISAANPTADGQVSDIYAGISQYNPSSLEITGWGRALEWKRYQESYCGNNIGSSYAPPCDKEWGWIKFNGKWQTVNRGTLISAGSCGTNLLNASSVDGYPDPTGTNERLRIEGQATTYQYATAIDQTNRRFTLTSPLPNPCVALNGKDVVWIADLASDVGVGATTISLTSINGLISAGTIEVVRAADDVVMTAVVYQKIDEAAKQLTNLTFDAAFAPPYTAGTYYIRQKKDTGNYNTFGIPPTASSAEVTLGGFAWSSPNTDSPVADPFGSRYRNNISGFGWINFQPNKLDLLYPYLRTLFSDVYASNDIILNPPSTSLSPSQFTSTYLIQKTGDILPFSGNPLVTAGAVAKCVQECLGNVTCETTCRDNLVESLTTPKVPNIKPFSGDSQGLGNLPNYDDLANMVSDCKRYDSTTSSLVDVACPDPAEEVGRKRTNHFDGNYTPTDLQLFKNDAVVGKNKFGNRVVLCRMDPNTALGAETEMPWEGIYIDNGYNPPECVWKDVGGWKATINSYTAAPPSLCVSGFQSYNNLEIPPSGYIKNPANGTRIAYSSLTLGAAPCAAGQTKIDLVSTVDPSPASGTTLEESPIVTFKRINPNATSDTASKEATVYIVPDDYGNNARFLSFTHAFLQADNGIVKSGQTTSGAVMLMFPGSVFFNDGQMRYCSSAPEGMRCTSVDDAANQNITNIRQLASIAWYTKGNWQSWLSPFAGYYPGGKLTHYHIGAIIVTGENSSANALFGTSPGTFASTITILFRGMQFHLSGLLVAKNIDFNSEYITQDSSTNVINEPSENIVYDGRAIANPPPGMSDLVIGLPKIEKITP